MPRLTPAQTSQLVDLMDARYARELKEIQDVAARSDDERNQAILAGETTGLLESALADVAMETDYAIVRQDIQDVRDILAARKRLAAGTYGICVDCGAAIAFERLLAYPTAKRCIACQREREIRRATAVRQ